jgi:hypothetical protein
MKDLRELERKRLIKELEYVRSDLEYKSEVVYEADNSFMKSLGALFEEKPLLKEMFDMTIGKKIEEMLEGRLAEESNAEAEEKEETESDRKLKKAYRDIAKATHPDRVSEERLNEIYIQAGSMYESRDVMGIYGICEKLGIPYEIGEEDGEMLKSQISEMKERILFMESTFAWKWFHTESENEKNSMLLEYIKSKII